MDRSCALTYSNVRKLYNDVYQCMVEAGVAKKLDVASDQFPSKLKTTYQLIHPEMCLVVNEVGSNISQQWDGHIAGKKYCCEKGCGVPQNKSSINDRHFTLLDVTVLTGKPVLYVVIIAGVIRDIWSRKRNWYWGTRDRWNERSWLLWEKCGKG